MKDSDIKIVEAMATYGGSFVKAVAMCARQADEENLARLKRAFPELWTEYATLVVRLEEEK